MKSVTWFKRRDLDLADEECLQIQPCGFLGGSMSILGDKYLNEDVRPITNKDVSLLFWPWHYLWVLQSIRCCKLLKPVRAQVG